MNKAIDSYAYLNAKFLPCYTFHFVVTSLVFIHFPIRLINYLHEQFSELWVVVGRQIWAMNICSNSLILFLLLLDTFNMEKIFKRKKEKNMHFALMSEDDV